MASFDRRSPIRRLGLALLALGALTGCHDWPALSGGSADGASVRGATFAATLDKNTVTLTLPAARPGDLLWAVLFAASGSVALSPPTGWELRFDLPNTAGGGSWRTRGYTRLAVDGEPAQETFMLAARELSGGVVVAYAGVDAAAIGTVAAVNLDVTTMALSAPSVDAPRPGSRLLAIFSRNQGVGTNWDPPPGMTELVDTGSLVVFDEPLPTAGPTGARTAAATVTFASAFAVALPPR